jgi:hypothetical protein
MDRGLGDWLSRLGPQELVEVLRDVLAAEANRVGAGPGVVHFSREVYRKDGGVDGTTDLPADTRPIFCPGPRTWQVRSGADPGIDISEKPRTRRHLGAGRDYILCWSGDDLITPKKEDVETGLQKWLGEHYPGRTATVLTVPDLIRMMEHTPAVVHRHGGPLFLGYTVEEWGRRLRVEEYPFVSDPARDDVTTGLRAFALGTEPYDSRHVLGDTGVGKSRVVFEALNVFGLREITAVVSDVSIFDDRSVRAAMSQPYARLVLVVDDVTDGQLESLRTLAAATAGRLRLITIGDRGTPRTLGADTNVFDLRPLPDGLITDLLNSAALPHLDATRAAQVAELAEGYPRLAVALAETVAAAPASLVPALLSRHGVGKLLSRMLAGDEATRQTLAVIALFDRVGVDRGVSHELQLVSSAFGVDPIAARAVLDHEEGRFVSAAGPYRRVTPRAFGAWLVGDLARRQPAVITNAVARLPEPLLDAFRRQLQFLGGDASINRVLEAVVDASAGRFLQADGTLTVTGAAFLYSLAYPVPQLAMRHLTAALAGRDAEHLRAQPPRVRREVVWALEHLLWFPETWRPAIDLLLRLAVAETETFGDNATTTLLGTFRLHLGGTATRYHERLRWWDRQYVEAERGGDTARATLLARALAAGLTERESRAGDWHGVLDRPAEYRPSREDAITLRGDIWRRLLDLTTSIAADQDVVTDLIAAHLRMAVRYPFADRVLGRVAGLAGLTPSSRAALGDALRGALRFDGDGLPEQIRQAVEASQVAILGGPGVLDRLPAILSTPVWHLDDLYTGEPPQVLVESADVLLDAGNLQRIEVALRQPEVDEQTMFAFALVLGRRAGTGVVASLLERPTLPSPAFTGLLRGLAEHAPDGTDAHLRDWLAAGSLVEALTAVPCMPATIERARMALEANERARAGGLPGRGVNRLAFGSWLNPLPPETVADVVDALVIDASDSDPYAVEAGMFAVFTYLKHVGGLETLPDPTGRRFEAAALRLIDIYDAWTGPIRDLSYLRAQLVRHLRLDRDRQLATALAGLIGDQPDHRHTLEAVRDACLAVGERSIDTVLRWLLQLPGADALHLRGAHLVSLLEAAFGTEPVLTALQPRTDEERATLLGQVDFSGDVPELALRLVDAGGPRAHTEAVTRYLYAEAGFIGSYASYLADRRAALEPLREQATEVHGASSNVASFLSELSDALGEAITSARHRD